MGCQPSKLKKINRKSKKEMDEDPEKYDRNDQCDFSDAALIEQEDREWISEIRNDLNKTPEIFVLNNVLMCTMFLRNYKEEVFTAFREATKPQENFWEPHTIIEKANRNVIYRPIHGPKKDDPTPLVTRRIYVPMDEFVEVCESFDSDNSSASVKSSKYQVKMEESKRNGFVKLQRINGGTNHDAGSTKDILVIPASSSTSGTSDTESTSTYIELLATDNPQLVKDEIDDSTPDDCFVYRKIEKRDINMQLEDLDHENLQEDDVYEIVSYLPSKKFMKYFQSKVFKEPIAEQLGIVQYEIDNAVVYNQAPGKVFCNIRNDLGSCYPAELLPCLKITWPHKQTFEFMQQLDNQRTNGKLKYPWPDARMLQHLKSLDCALIPRGSSRSHRNPKMISRTNNSDGDLEWEIQFPLAERYLEATLTPEQIKCYLVLLTVFKEYVEPYTKGFGILPEHIMNLIFWEAEKNYEGWPEHRLGLKLIRLVKKFSNHLSQREFNDYFIRKKNIFKYIRREYLEHANKKFHEITQSPVILIIKALRNIRYLSASFYPPLNYKELLDILYKKDWNENPYFSSLDMDRISTSVTSMGEEKKPKFQDAKKQLQYVKEKERRKKLREKREEEEYMKKNGYSYGFGYDARRNSTDSINSEWQCEKEFDQQKKIALLKFFIKTYIDIIKTCIRVASKTQTLFYIKQAWYLTKILEIENQLFAAEVTDYFKEIKKQEDLVIGSMQKNVEVYGRLDVVNDDDVDEEHVKQEEEEADLANLDDVLKSDITMIKQDVIVNDLHQQLKRTQINLSTLSKAFNPNRVKEDSFGPS